MLFVLAKGKSTYSCWSDARRLNAPGGSILILLYDRSLHSVQARVTTGRSDQCMHLSSQPRKYSPHNHLVVMIMEVRRCCCHAMTSEMVYSCLEVS